MIELHILHLNVCLIAYRLGLHLTISVCTQPHKEPPLCDCFHKGKERCLCSFTFMPEGQGVRDWGHLILWLSEYKWPCNQPCQLHIGHRITPPPANTHWTLPDLYDQTSTPYWLAPQTRRLTIKGVIALIPDHEPQRMNSSLIPTILVQHMCVLQTPLY